jgi:putative endonuclease
VVDPRHDLGRRGEEAVASWLAAAGWIVLERRWRGGRGELDLVCLDPSGVLVGIEVKLRRTARAGSGEESVGAERLRRLRSALARYAADAPANLPHRGLRLDLVTLSPVGADRWRLRRLPAIDAW